MKPLFRWVLILLLAELTANLSVLGAESTNWVTVFDESFADNPHQRFRMLPVTVPGASLAEGSGGYDQLRRVFSLGGYLSLLRPVHAGAHVEWLLKLRFLPPKAEDPQELETDLMLVLANRTMAGIEMRRSKATNAATVVRFVHQQSDELPVKVLREMRVPTIPVEGTWMLRYRHGLLTWVQGTNTLGSVDLEFLGVPVMGVLWIQKGGVVECAGMTLTGETHREMSVKESQTTSLQRKQQPTQPLPQSLDELAQVRTKADKGDAEGQFVMGDAYRSGRTGKADYVEAMKWYRKAAEQGHVRAQNNLGVMYANGHGVPRDQAEAVRWYRKAAEQGFAGAQINLGCCYEAGQGVPQDYAEALKWYRKAAEQGEAIGQYNVGGMCYRGQGVPQDYAEAVKWFHRAAEQGNAMAQCNLGVCYYEGQGVAKDVVEAYAWLSLAAERNENAANNCAVFEKEMRPQQLFEAQKRAKELRALIEARLNRRTP